MHYRCPLESGGLSLRMFGRSSGGIRESPASFPARTLQQLSRKSVTPCRGLIRRSRLLGPLDSLIPHWTDPTPGRVDRFSRQPPRLKTGARPSSCERRARAREQSLIRNGQSRRVDTFLSPAASSPLARLSRGRARPTPARPASQRADRGLCAADLPVRVHPAVWPADRGLKRPLDIDDAATP